jgi:hypothetical protein
VFLRPSLCMLFIAVILSADSCSMSFAPLNNSDIC